MDEKIQKIGLGTVQFGIPYGISNTSGQTSPKEVTRILEIAKANGVQILDTASAYGSAEKVLGQNDLSSFKIISKFMPFEEGVTISEQLQKSLDDLRVPALYGYLAHRPADLVENLHQWDELKSLRKEGKIQKIGFSLNKPVELDKLLDQNVVPDIIQVPFNYFDRRFRDRMISLNQDGCEVHIRSAFLQGLFFMDIRKLDDYFVEVAPLIEHLQKNCKNLPGSLLDFVLEQPFVDCVIIGVENGKQFIENLDSFPMLERLPDLEQNISESILTPSTWPN